MAPSKAGLAVAWRAAGLRILASVFSFAKSFETREYAGEMGATGTPTCMPASVSNA